MRVPSAHALTISALAGLIAAHASAEPSRKIVATVLSLPIYANAIEPSPDEMRDIPAHANQVERADRIEHLRGRRLEARIIWPLQKRFCSANACEPTKEEVQSVLDMGTDGTGSGERPSGDASTRSDATDKSDRAKAERSKDAIDLQRREAREVARDWVGTWKFHKALYEKYGGEVIMQVVGPNAVGARRKWLEDEEAKGHFHIFTPELRAAFYDAVSAYGGRPIPAESAGEVFAAPPWAALGRDPNK